MVITAQDVHKELQAFKEHVRKRDAHVDSMIETLDIVSNPETMERLAQAEREVLERKTKSFTSVQDLLEEA